MKVHGKTVAAGNSRPDKKRPKQPETVPDEQVDSYEITGTGDSSCIIKGESSLSPQQKRFIRSTIHKAVQFFAGNFGEVKRPLVLSVLDTGDVLRTGYHVKDDVINFPPDEKGRRPALDSADILVHEAFHALVAQAYPQLTADQYVNESEYVRLHEGLADYFTHQLYPDESFAEGLGEGGKPLRNYRNRRRVSLSPGGHSQGNALTSYLLDNQVTPDQVRGFLEDGDFSLRGLAQISPKLDRALQLDASLSLKDKVANYPASDLRKYWLEEGKPLEVAFEANQSLQETHPNLSIEWLRPSGFPSKTFVFDETEPNRFRVEPKGHGAEKVLAVFRDGQEIIGSRPFYFGSKD